MRSMLESFTSTDLERSLFDPYLHKAVQVT